ncbi:hypothetical protein [Luteimonas abyssi]|uniref:hypothetical protein n=1 Tax=Luteimonas abyssi TaxID=1247514 RepID=UPI000737AD5C|nr:hypothetical protein [Luteimonas abyssi]
MQKIKTTREAGPQQSRGADGRDALEQLIDKMEQRAPQGSGLDRQGVAPQSTCAGRIYCF